MWGRAMLESLNDHVRECLSHAEDCVQQAAAQTDPKLRRNYLIIGACWLKLSYELSDQLASKPPVGTTSNQAMKRNGAVSVIGREVSRRVATRGSSKTHMPRYL
jgi:hypothetical protein